MQLKTHKTNKQKNLIFWHFVHSIGTYRVLENVLPLSKSTHRLLDADDLVSNGLVPFDLQLHVMVVLTRDKQRQSRNIFIKDGLPKFMLT